MWRNTLGWGDIEGTVSHSNNPHHEVWPKSMSKVLLWSLVPFSMSLIPLNSGAQAIWGNEKKLKLHLVSCHLSLLWQLPVVVNSNTFHERARERSSRRERDKRLLIFKKRKVKQWRHTSLFWIKLCISAWSFICWKWPDSNLFLLC